MRRGFTIGLMLGLFLCLPPAGLAQQAAGQTAFSSAQNARLGGEGTADESRLRDAQETYNIVLREVRDGVSSSPKLGPVETKFQLPIYAGPHLTLPLLKWGIRPEDAELKLGRFYLDLRDVTLSLLFSDNANQTETNPKSGVIGILSANVAAIFQLNDALQLGIAAKLYYLPFKNEMGIGNPFADIGYNLGAQPAFDARLTYTALVGGWEVNMYDTFTARYIDFSAVDGFDVFDSNVTAAQDRLGTHYGFGQNPVATGRRGPLSRVTSRNQLALVNTYGFSIDRMLPTETRLTAGYAHDNYWYQNPNGSASVRDDDRLFIRLDSERENLRFKPFLGYEARKSGTDKDWRHTVQGGVVAEVTEQVDFLGDFGFTTTPSNGAAGGGSTRTTWHLSIKHAINPDMFHQLEYGREVSQPVNLLSETIRYRFRQILGPYVVGEFILMKRDTTDLDDPLLSGRQDLTAGIRFMITPSPRTTVTPAVLFTHGQITGSTTSTVDILRGRLVFDHRLSDLLTLTFRYEYTDWMSSAPGDSFVENFASLSLTRRF